MNILCFIKKTKLLKNGEAPIIIRITINGWAGLLMNNKISIERIDQIRDIFLFCCFTGLAFSDIKKLDSSQISKGIDGGKWIYTNRQKTDTRATIPLWPMALEILGKYINQPQCLNSVFLLPVLVNQKMNNNLKEIADFCEVEKKLTYHIASHTFATTITLISGDSIESVSKMLGHKSLTITQHYAKILVRKVSDDMMLLREKLLPKPKSKLNKIYFFYCMV